MQQAFFRFTRLLGDPPRPAAGACGVAGVTTFPVPMGTAQEPDSQRWLQRSATDSDGG